MHPKEWKLLKVLKAEEKDSIICRNIVKPRVPMRIQRQITRNNKKESLFITCGGLGDHSDASDILLTPTLVKDYCDIYFTGKDI